MPETLAWGPGGGETLAPGTIIAQSLAGRVQFGPRPDRTLVFGRGDPDVHVCIGEADLGVSREQGTVTYRDGRWQVANTGALPVRLPSRLLCHAEEPVPLDDGYTPVYIRGTGRREHLIELYVVGPAGRGPVPRHQDPTAPPRRWRLSREERLALIALGQRYLRHERYAQPVTRQAAADFLAEAEPGRHWTGRRVEHLANDVRRRLAKAGVPGLTAKEVGKPVGNALNHNLLHELILSTTLVPLDIAKFDAKFD